MNLYHLLILNPLELSFGLIIIKTYKISITSINAILAVLKNGLSPGAKTSITEIIKVLVPIVICIPNKSELQSVRTKALRPKD